MCGLKRMRLMKGKTMILHAVPHTTPARPQQAKREDLPSPVHHCLHVGGNTDTLKRALAKAMPVQHAAFQQNRVRLDCERYIVYP